jgi:DNA-binding NarL/FixJ family response regulator
MPESRFRADIIAVDRRPLFRLGLLAALREANADWHCTGVSFDDLRDALASTERKIVLLDLHIPALGSIEGLAGLCAHYPRHRFIAIAETDDPDAILAVLRAGARGYILRDADPIQFVRAIDIVMTEGVVAPASLTTAAFVHPIAAAVMHDPVAAPANDTAEQPVDADGFPEPALLHLTERQREVLRLLGEGCATKTIARRMDLAVGTVKVHLAAIYRTLGATSRLEAVAKAHRRHVGE